MLLTFELHPDGDELDVHLDAEGLKVLRSVLDAVERTGSHEHLMTPSWSGSELTEEKQDPRATLLNKVTVHVWPRTGTG